VYQVELRIRAVLKHEVVEFAKEVELPFVPVAWMWLREADTPEGEDGLHVEQVVWDLVKGRFICRLLDGLDASMDFGDDINGLKHRYVSRGWRVWNEGRVARLFLQEEPA
jgi:hypothetical protein